jgi:hypothetical protein
MKKVLIAFDVDGTLRNNDANPYGTSDDIVANERVRSLLIILASMKNTKIMVWSGGGELYARQVSRALGIDKYVDVWADKAVTSCLAAACPEPDQTHWHFAYEGPQPDIAVDDIQSFSLGAINLIVKEK